jgi:hypothetical protein
MKTRDASLSPEGLGGLVLRLLARDTDIAKQMTLELAQVLALAPSLMHTQERSEPARKTRDCYCGRAPQAQD